MLKPYEPPGTRRWARCSGLGSNEPCEGSPGWPDLHGRSAGRAERRSPIRVNVHVDSPGLLTRQARSTAPVLSSEITLVLIDPLERERGVRAGLRLSGCLRRVPCGGDLALRIARARRSSELVLAVVVEAVLREYQQPASPIRRIVLAAPMLERLAQPQRGQRADPIRVGDQPSAVGAASLLRFEPVSTWTRDGSSSMARTRTRG